MLMYLRGYSVANITPMPRTHNAICAIKVSVPIFRLKPARLFLFIHGSAGISFLTTDSCSILL